jgi:hypothetical protein
VTTRAEAAKAAVPIAYEDPEAGEGGDDGDDGAPGASGAAPEAA